MLKYKQNRKLIQCSCDYWHKLYDKPRSEYNRNIRLNKHNFCSRSCSYICHDILDGKSSKEKIF